MTGPVEPKGPEWSRELPKKGEGLPIQPGRLPETLKKAQGSPEEKIALRHRLVHHALPESILSKLSDSEQKPLFQSFDVVAALASGKIADEMIKFLSEKNIDPNVHKAAMKGIEEAFLHVLQKNVSPEEFSKAHDHIRNLLSQLKGK